MTSSAANSIAGEQALADARLYLKCLDPAAAAFTFLTRDDKLLETGKPREDRALLKQLHGSFDDVLPTLLELNKRGAGVFVAVNRTDFKGRRRSNITAARALWHDQDTANVEPLLPQNAEPNFVVETSPGKKQRIWLVEEGLTLERCADAMRTMVEKHHSDPNAALLTQVLRLPGFWHNKRTPHLVRILSGISADMGAPCRWSPERLLTQFPPTQKVKAALGETREPGEQWNAERVRDALKHVPQTAESALVGDYEHWLKIGMALHHGSNGAAEGLELWHDWSEAQADKYESDMLDYKWSTFRSEGDSKVTLGSLYSAARKGGWHDTAPAEAFTKALLALEAARDQQARGFKTDSEINISDAIEKRKKALVRGLLSPKNIAVIYGESGSGKTFFALDLVWHLVLGRNWHGHRVRRRVACLYVNLEGEEGFDERIKAAEDKHGNSGGYFNRLDVPGVWLGKGDSPEEKALSHYSMERIKEAANGIEAKLGVPVELIIIDTLRQAMAGDDENSTETMMHFIRKRMHKLRDDTGAAVMVIHHTNKTGTMAGNNSLKGACDWRVRIDVNNNLHTATVDKNKNGEEGKLFDYRREKVHLGVWDDDGEIVPVESCVIRQVVEPPNAAQAFGVPELVQAGVRGMVDGEQKHLSRVVADAMKWDAATRSGADKSKQLSLPQARKLIQETFAGGAVSIGTATYYFDNNNTKDGGVITCRIPKVNGESVPATQH